MCIHHPLILRNGKIVPFYDEQSGEDVKRHEEMKSLRKKRSAPRVIKIRKHPFGKNYLAINLFGFIFSLRDLDPVELNHELIHSAQQREMLYLPFFFWYGIEWLLKWFKYRDWTTAYYHIGFEQEAYRNQRDLNYLNRRRFFGFL